MASNLVYTSDQILSKWRFEDVTLALEENLTGTHLEFRVSGKGKRQVLTALRNLEYVIEKTKREIERLD